MALERLIVVGPVPPPFHGVSVSTLLVLKNGLVRATFAVEHLDTSDPRPIATVGKWDIRNGILALGALVRLLPLLRGDKGILYLPISQGRPGFLRDSILIHVARLARWKVAIHLRGSEMLDFYACSGRLWRGWMRKTLRSVDSAAVMGEGLRWLLSGFLPLRSIEAVPNGTPDQAGLVDSQERERCVLFLSNLRRRKGVVEAIDAALRVAAVEADVCFRFVGEWESSQLRDDLLDRAAAWGDRIQFLPPVIGADKDRLLAQSFIFLFPPVEPEGHPRVLLEAMAAGLPVITTNRGAIPDTVIDGKTGFVLDDPDSELLAERVLNLIRDEALRNSMGAAARHRYVEFFSQEQADRRLAEWLERVRD